MLNRPDAYTVPGGDTAQMEQTARRLREHGVEVEISVEPRPLLEGYDLAHIFNLSRPDSAAVQARHVHEHGLPFVLTPIHQLMSRYDREGRGGLSLLYRSLPTSWMNRARSWYLRRSHRDSDKSWILRNAAAVLPTSDLEGEQLRRDFGPTAPLITVPLGIDLAEKRTRTRSGVLCAARIEPLKNQIALIEALARTGIRLRLAGAVSPRHPRWTRRCLRLLRRSGGEYLGVLGREDLAAAYAEAEVHALPSWFESASIASLEAAWHGCRIACTSVGYARAYLQDDAQYCDPGDVGSIREAVKAALASSPSNALRERIRTTFNWERTAEETLAAYRLLRNETPIARDSRR